MSLRERHFGACLYKNVFVCVDIKSQDKVKINMKKVKMILTF
nr:MAG TPA: hypothetical protein [Caudoviricetes sp.]